MDKISRIKDLLSRRTSKHIENNAGYIHAAVLIPLFLQEGIYKILFTRRTTRVEHHKGQISFPGGTVEDKDRSLEETALRESFEEIGLLQKDVEILGRIDDALTVASNFIVHPFVGRIPYPYPFKINTLEVDRILAVPLEIFYREEAYRTKGPAGIVDPSYDGPIYKHEGDTIWGATARIMENLVRITGKNFGLPEKDK